MSMCHEILRDFAGNEWFVCEGTAFTEHTHAEPAPYIRPLESGERIALCRSCDCVYMSDRFEANRCMYCAPREADEGACQKCGATFTPDEVACSPYAALCRACDVIKSTDPLDGVCIKCGRFWEGCFCHA